MPNQPSSSSKGLKPEPPSFEKRLPLALALMMLVLLASQYFFKPAPGPKPVTPANKEQAAKVTDKPASTQAAATQPAPGPAVAGRLSASTEKESFIDTTL